MDNNDFSQRSEGMQQVAELQNGEWNKLSPISIIYFTVRSIVDLANTFFYLIPVLALNFNKIKEQPLIIVVVVSCILALFIIMGVLNYWFYRFRVGSDRIEIKQGVFKKSHIDLPFERIQNVKLSQPLYYRINDYSCIELDTAGSAKQEAKIVALKTDLAKQFRIKILDTATEKTSDDALASSIDSSNASNEKILNRRSIRDLVIHGLTNNRIWIFLGALAPFYNAISDFLSQFFESIGFDAEVYFSLETQAWWEFGLHVLSVAMLIMLVIVSLSVVGAILMFYKYTLSKTQNRYIRRSGLLTKHEVSMKLSRIQIMVQAQDWLDVLLGRVNLSFEQNTSGVANASKAGEQMSNKLLVPSVTIEESLALMKDAMPSQTMGEQVFKPISKRYILRGLLFFALPVGLFLFVAIFRDDLVVATTVSFSTVALIGVILVIRWKRWGYSYDQEYFYLRKGFLGVNYYCFPLYKVQQAQFKQSIFIRPYQLASLKIVLASGAKLIPYMPANEVRNIINSILDQLVIDKRSWM
ncbi:MAG: putative membrane protein [Glaciecola sp.]|jgi:putative membrane protein